MRGQSVEERREQLVRAAITIISSEGISKASTRRISAAADISQPALHYAYRNKEELFLEVIDSGTSRFRQAIELAEKGAGLVKTTEWLMWEIFDEFMTRRDLFAALLEVVLWAWHLPDDGATARRVYDTYNGLTADVLRQGLKPDTTCDVTPLAQFIVATMDGLLLQIVTYDDEPKARELCASFVRAGVLLAESYEKSAQQVGSTPRKGRR